MRRPKSKFTTEEKKPTPPQVTFSIRVPKEHLDGLRTITKVYRKKRNMIISEMLGWAIKDQLSTLDDVKESKR